MPMHGHPIVDPTTGRVIGIACSRGPRYAKCATCRATGAKLSCDGCDAPLCAACAVGPTSKLDFCPTCTMPVFEHWKTSEGGAKVYAEQGRARGRVEFRAWVKANKAKFSELAKPRTEASKQEAP